MSSVEASGLVPLSRSALIQRANKALAHEGRALRVTRVRWRADLGTFYILDIAENAVVARHVELEGFARERGLLAPWERLVP